MISKAEKPPDEPNSYRPISVLLGISKLFEKLYIKRLKPVIEERKLIPDHLIWLSRAAFYNRTSSLVSIAESSLEEKKVCVSVFLDVAQAFDKVWHHGLLQKCYVIS